MGRRQEGWQEAIGVTKKPSCRMLMADPNAANDFAATPLMWCAGDAAKVQLLLSKSAKVDARSKLGRTSLLIAAAYDGATEAARLLIEKGADVNARDQAGNCADTSRPLASVSRLP